MKKHAYRARNINQICVETLLSKMAEEMKAVVAVDVAKSDFAVGFARGGNGEIVEHLKFKHPLQTMQFLELLEVLRRGGSSLEVVLEPTGTYGDALVGQLMVRRFPVFAMSPKRCHDAAEVFDGVPSSHDVKATAVLARLHAEGLSKPWAPDDEGRRTLRAAISRRELYATPLEADYGRLEALLSRYWPELGEHLDPRHQKTVLALLVEFPGPQAVAAAPEAAAAKMVEFSHHHLAADKIAAAVASAEHSLGVPMNAQERQLLSALAGQILEFWRQTDLVDEEIAELTRSHTATRALAPTVGVVTAAVMVAMLGKVSSYPSASSYVKAMGLNLKECSSGTSKKAGTGLHITKRGPSLVRKYLFMAALRLIQSDPICRAWYQNRKAFRRGEKLKAVVALMRKLSRALWHVGRGEPFDSSKLFDSRRLVMDVVMVSEQAVNG